MILPSHAYGADGSGHPYRWPFIISLSVHLLLLGLVIYSPSWDRDSEFMPSVIDVQMVDLSDLNPAPVQSAAKSKEAANIAEPPEEKTASAPIVQEQTTAKPEVSVAPPRKKTKTSLKAKTFKSKKVLKNALKRVERKVETLPPKPLEDTIKRLRDKVAKEGKPAPEAPVNAKSGGKAQKGLYHTRGSQKEIELIDLYRAEIAYTINKNWAYAEQLAGGGSNLVASIVFKVMPDGRITDVFFVDRSGNRYLDESAHKAIMKSSPVQPHPEKLLRPYVELGLNFTPEGVQ